MPKVNLVKIVAITFFIVAGSILSYFLVGLPFTLVFLLMCFDSLIVGRFVKMQFETGVELATFSTLLVAIIYGSWMALIFGVFLVPIITGIVGLVMWGFSTPAADVGWTPLIPSPDSLTIGLAGFVAGIVYSGFNFVILAGVAGVIARTAFQTIKEIVMGGVPRIFAYIINSALTLGLLFMIQKLILLIM